MKKLMALAGLLLPGFASAAIPAAVSTALTDLTTDAGTYMGVVTGLTVIVAIGFIWLKLLKKGGNKAT